MDEEQIRMNQLAMEMSVKRGFEDRRDSMRNVKGSRNTGAASRALREFKPKRNQG